MKTDKGTRWTASVGMTLASTGPREYRAKIVSINRPADIVIIEHEHWMKGRTELRLSMVEGNMTGWRPPC